jgi:predicted transcriptional regulator
MSHEATTWAGKQRGITAAQFRILFVLADCHNPARGCFPTQEYLTQTCEMSERTVRDLLTSLEQMGLIRRDRRANDLGHRTGTYYIFAFESLPAESRNLQKPTGKITSAYRQNHVRPTGNCLPVGIDEPVNELVREPVRLSLEQFDAFWKAYPLKKGKDNARKAFLRAIRQTPAETIIAGVEQAKASDRRFKNRQYTPHPATWLNSGGWTDDPDGEDLFTTHGKQEDSFAIARRRILGQEAI